MAARLDRSIKTSIVKQLQRDNELMLKTRNLIQKEFKVTPHYLEMNNYDEDQGYRMGVYICLGQPIHAANKEAALIFEDELKNFQAIHNYMENNESILVFLADGIHKIKRKAEQIACEKCINFLNH